MRAFAVVALFAGSAAAAELEPVSRIDSVIVHPDAAVVTRIAEVDMPAGANTLVIRGLPPGLDRSSLRVEGSGDVAFTILGVDLRASPGEARPVIDQALEAKITTLKDERAALGGRIEALERKKATIEIYAAASPEKLSPEAKPLDVSQWAAAWEAIGEGLTKVHEELRVLRRRAADLDAEIAALEAARPRPGRPGAPKTDLAVALEADRAVRGALRFAYRVTGASWMPLYDARLVTSEGSGKPSLTLVRRAAVTQRTGEDWTDVRLSVSTVATNRGTAAPELPPLLAAIREPVQPDRYGGRTGRGRLEKAEPRPAPPPAPGALAPPAETMAWDGERADADGLLELEAGERRAGVEATGFTVVFTIPGRVAIPADGSIKTLLIGDRAFEPSISLESVPVLDPAAYIEASFVLEDEAPVFPGEVTLQRDGVLVGRNRLPLVAPGDKVEIGFGIDDRVKVVRVPLRRRESEPGLFGSNKSDVQEFRTTVKNLHGGPIQVRIVDRMPYVENTAIQVETVSGMTQPTERTVSGRRGVMTWLLEVPAGAEKEIRFGYTVKWPFDKELVLTPQSLTLR